MSLNEKSRPQPPQKPPQTEPKPPTIKGVPGQPAPKPTVAPQEPWPRK